MQAAQPFAAALPMTEPPLPSAARVSWFAAASRGRLRVTLAAILLMLHWAAPGISTFEAAPGQIDAGYSTAQYGTAPGTLPRLMTRTQGYEAESKGPQRSDDPPIEKAKVFHAASLPVEPAAAGSNAIPDTAGPRHSSFNAASFKARAPPSPQV